MGRDDSVGEGVWQGLPILAVRPRERGAVGPCLHEGGHEDQGAGHACSGVLEVSSACVVEVHPDACTAVCMLNRWDGVLCVRDTAVALLLRVLQS